MTTLYQELRHLAETIDTAKPYHQTTRFPWLLSLDASGRPQGGLQPLWETQVGKNGKERQVRGVQHYTPSLKRTAGVSPIVPHDGIGYVLGWCDEASKPDRIAESHNQWAAMIRAWRSGSGAQDPIASALVQFLGHVGEVDKPDEWASKDAVLVQVDGVNAHLAASIIPFWTSRVEGAKSVGAQGECLVCGSVGSLVATLPQGVKGTLIPGGQTSGVAPISINAPAFGFNLTTGLAHVPICAACAQSIPVALNHLLSDETRTERSTNTATTWWITGDSPWNPNPLLNDPQPGDIKALQEAVHKGVRPKQVSPERWNGLVLAANGPRMIVKDWTSLPLSTVQQNVLDWFSDIEIDSRFIDDRRWPTLTRLAQVTGRHERQGNKYLFLGDRAGHHFHEAIETLRGVALLGQNPPPAMLTHVMARITADQQIDYPRAALLRLIMRRTYTRGHLMPGLDDQCAEPCYVAGRLFAIYGDMQYSSATANGGNEPNSTFVDKHLAGAISDPRSAIAAGEKQSAAWLNKLKRADRAQFFQRDVDEVMALLQPTSLLPMRASMEEQALFVLGYHHQRAHTARRRAEAKQRKAIDALPPETTTD